MEGKTLGFVGVLAAAYDFGLIGKIAPPPKIQGSNTSKRQSSDLKDEK